MPCPITKATKITKTTEKEIETTKTPAS